MAKYLSYSGLEKVWAKIKANFVKKSGDAMTGALSTTESLTAGTFIRSSGNSVYLGSGSGSQGHIQYDSTNECIKFIFD